MTAHQKYSDNKTTGFEFRTLTPADATIYPPEAGLKAIYINGGGNAVLEDHEGNEVTLAVTTGQYLYLRPRIIKTATTATIVGIFS